jgi:hypothetical protein
VQSLAADAERILETLIRPGRVTVEGDADAVYAYDHSDFLPLTVR